MKDIIEFKVPIKRYRQLIFFFGAGSIVLAVLILSIPVMAVLNTDFIFHQEFVGYVIFFPILSMYSMWLIFGYEKVIINRHNIELLKSNKVVSTKKTFSIADIVSIEVVEKKLRSDKWIDVQRERIREKHKAFPFWLKMGQLKLVTRNGEVTFFNGLSILEMQPMKEEIEKEIKKRKHNNVYKQ